MELKDYQPLALRTAPPKEGELLSWKQLQLVHALLGMTGELGEILNAEEDIENLDEEIGDTMWYLALAADALHFELEELDKGYTSDDPYQDLPIAMSKFVDHIKRHLFYRTEIRTEECSKMLSDILGCLQSLSDLYGGRPFELSLTANIAKLSARYPEKFTEEAAVNRNIKAETEAFRNAES